MLLVVLWAILVAGAGIAATLRRETTLVRGSTIFRFHAAFLAAQALWLVAARVRSQAGALDAPGGAVRAGLLALAVFGALTAATVPLRRLWVLSGFDETGFRETLELSLRQLRMGFEEGAAGYTVTVGSGRSRIAWRPLGRGRAILSFGLGLSDGGKPALLRALLAKRLGRLVPRPRIRFD